eukprot:1158726-Pelagomonas_calceolata.AAC.3
MEGCLAKNNNAHEHPTAHSTPQLLRPKHAPTHAVVGTQAEAVAEPAVQPLDLRTEQGASICEAKAAAGAAGLWLLPHRAALIPLQRVACDLGAIVGGRLPVQRDGCLHVQVAHEEVDVCWHRQSNTVRRR